VTRVTAAYGASETAEDLIVAAAGVASRVGASLRIASFAVWSRPDYTTRLGTEPEDPILQEWLETTRQTAAESLEQLEELPEVPRDIHAVIGHGTNWADAIDDIAWGDGDVLVVGSSSVGPVASVFLGSRAAKIVRHSPVPVIVVPRQKAAELADLAMRG
jgi:nucleotide-binding universal stress UspA family protein